MKALWRAACRLWNLFRRIIKGGIGMNDSKQPVGQAAAEQAASYAGLDTANSDSTMTERPKRRKMVSLPIEVVRGLPRRAKRKIWRGWWKHSRAAIKGESRREQRREWRGLWAKLRVVR